MNKPNIFIGTMYCGEGDFEYSKSSILNQKNVVVNHLIIKDLNEKDAHNELWSLWNKNRKDYDLFLKVDADTVLFNENICYEYWKLFQSNSRITGVQASLLDYYTNSYINGLNCFSSKVSFLETKDNLYCDRNVEINHDLVIKANSNLMPISLRPAGYHCQYSTEIQAFHFGVHRALKNQFDIKQKVYDQWILNKDNIRAYVLLGFDYAKSIKNFNYCDKSFNSYFDNAKSFFEKRILIK